MLYSQPGQEYLLLQHFKLDPTDYQQAPAAQHLLESDEAIPYESRQHHRSGQSFKEQEVTFDNINPGLSPSKMMNEIEELRTELKQSQHEYEQLVKLTKQIKQDLSIKQGEIYERQAVIGKLETVIRSDQKRKAALEFQISKLNKLLSAQKVETERAEEQITKLSELLFKKQAEIIDAKASTSKLLQTAEAQKESLRENFEKKSQDTKRLVQQLNQLNQQKESRMAEELQQLRKVQESLGIQLESHKAKIKQLQAELHTTNKQLSTVQSQHEKDLINSKLEAERIVGELKANKETEFSKLTINLKSELDKVEKELRRVQGVVALKDKQIFHIQQNMDSFRTRQFQKHQTLKLDYENKLSRKDQDIQRLKQQISRYQSQVKELEAALEQAVSKNLGLERSSKELYQQMASLESRLAEASRNRAAIGVENSQLQSELRHLKQMVTLLESKNRELVSQQTEHIQDLKTWRMKCTTLEADKESLQRRLKEIQKQMSKLADSQHRLVSENSNLKQSLNQKQRQCQTSKQQGERLASFVDTYKLNAEKMRQNTDKKWKELKGVYERQLHDMEQRLKAAERREGDAHLRLESMERQCKQYEFQITMSSDVRQFEPSVLRL